MSERTCSARNGATCTHGYPNRLPRYRRNPKPTGGSQTAEQEDRNRSYLVARKFGCRTFDHLRGRDPLILDRRKAPSKHRLPNEGNWHSLIKGRDCGPFPRALLACRDGPNTPHDEAYVRPEQRGQQGSGGRRPNCENYLAVIFAAVERCVQLLACGISYCLDEWHTVLLIGQDVGRDFDQERIELACGAARHPWYVGS